MFGLPLWVFYVLPFVTFGVMWWVMNRTKAAQDEMRRAGRRELPPMWPLLVGMFALLGSVVIVIGAMGQAEENQVKAACAKHGMAPWREAWGRSRCIDKNGQLRAFEDVR